MSTPKDDFYTNTIDGAAAFERQRRLVYGPDRDAPGVDPGHVRGDDERDAALDEIAYIESLTPDQREEYYRATRWSSAHSRNPWRGGGR